MQSEANIHTSISCNNKPSQYKCGEFRKETDLEIFQVLAGFLRTSD